MVWNPFSRGSSQEPTEDEVHVDEESLLNEGYGDDGLVPESELEGEIPPWLLEDTDENADQQQPLPPGSWTGNEVHGDDGVVYSAQGMSASDVSQTVHFENDDTVEEAVDIATYTANGGKIYQPYADVAQPTADQSQPAQAEGKGWLDSFTSWCGRQWDSFSSWCGRQADAIAGVFSSDDKPQEAGVQTTSSNAQGEAQADGAGASQEEGHWWDSFTSWCGRQWDGFSSWCGRQADAIAGVFSSDDKPQEAGVQTTSSNAQGEAQADGAGAKPAETRGVTSTGYVQTTDQMWATHGRELKDDVIVVKGVTVDEMRKSGRFTEQEIYEVYRRVRARQERYEQNPDCSRRLAAEPGVISMTAAELGISKSQVAVLQKLGREE